MLCNHCVKSIISPKICSKCHEKFCSNSCLERHKLCHKSKHTTNNLNLYAKPIIQKYQSKTLQKNSPYITDGFIVNKIQYDKIYNIKNFVPVMNFNEPKIVGTGSYGEVIVVKNIINNKLYAIKHMSKKHLNKTLRTLNGIKQEINIQSRIYHPNIVRLLYVKEDNENYELVMEYANYGNLFYYIRKKKYLTEKESFKYFIQIANAIYFLHLNDIIHRDIKPENILIYEENNVKLCDFGWCVRLDGKQRQTFCGTTEYMAPEIINNDKYNKSTDVWSLGILLYEMTHGYSPFIPHKENFKSSEIMQNIRKHELKFKKDISDECKELICRLLENNKEKRWKVEDIFNSKFVKKYENYEYFFPNSDNLENYYTDNNKKNNDLYDNGYISNNNENVNYYNMKKLNSDISQVLSDSRSKSPELNTQNILSDEYDCRKLNTSIKDYDMKKFDINKNKKFNNINLINNEERNSPFSYNKYSHISRKKVEVTKINLKNFETFFPQDRKLNINISHAKKKSTTKKVNDFSNIITITEPNIKKFDKATYNNNFNSLIPISPSNRNLYIKDQHNNSNDTIPEYSNISYFKDEKKLTNNFLENNINYNSCKEFYNNNNNSKPNPTNIKIFLDLNEYDSQRNDSNNYKIRNTKRSFAKKNLSQPDLTHGKINKSGKLPISKNDNIENIIYKNNKINENDNYNYEKDSTVVMQNENNDNNIFNKKPVIKFINKNYNSIEFIRPENILILNKNYSIYPSDKKNFKNYNRIEENIQKLPGDIIPNEIYKNGDIIIPKKENNYQLQQNLFNEASQFSFENRTSRPTNKNNLYNYTNPNSNDIYYDSTYYINNINKKNQNISKNNKVNNIDNNSDKNIGILSNTSDENIFIKNIDDVKYNNTIEEFPNIQNNITEINAINSGDYKNFIKITAPIRNIFSNNQKINHNGKANKILYTNYYENGNGSFVKNNNINNYYTIDGYISNNNNQNVIHLNGNTNYNKSNANYNVNTYMNPLGGNKFIENKNNVIHCNLKSYDLTPKKKIDTVKIIPYQLIKNANCQNKIYGIY